MIKLLCYLSPKGLMIDVEDQGRKVYHMDLRVVGLFLLCYLITSHLLRLDGMVDD